MVLLALCAVANAAKLNDAYLPPPNAKDAGGRDEDLQVPLEPPYIDPYSDNSYPLRNDFGRRVGQRRNQQRGDQEEDQFRGFAPGKSRFLYGSYSYTGEYLATNTHQSKPTNSSKCLGPDNVLVTVTYTADKKRPKNRKKYEDEYDDYDYGGRRVSGYGYDADDEDGAYAGPLEAGVVPTPPSLPKELQKAFNFHQKKYQSDSRKGSWIFSKHSQID